MILYMYLLLLAKRHGTYANVYLHYIMCMYMHSCTYYVHSDWAARIHACTLPFVSQADLEARIKELEKFIVYTQSTTAAHPSKVLGWVWPLIPFALYVPGNIVYTEEGKEGDILI